MIYTPVLKGTLIKCVAPENDKEYTHNLTKGKIYKVIFTVIYSSLVAILDDNYGDVSVLHSVFIQVSYTEEELITIFKI